MTSYQPNGEQAAVGWVKTVPGIDSTKVATTLPGDPKVWASTGFVTCTTVGGATNHDVLMRSPVVSIDVWRVLLNSEKAPWGEAAAQAETIFNAFFDPARFPLRVVNTGFYPINVHTGYPVSEVRKIPGSESNYAHLNFDAALHWTAVTA